MLLAICLAAGTVVAQGPAQTQVQTELDEAYALLRSEKLEEAAAAFLRVLGRDPQNRVAQLELGYLGGRLGRWAEAVKYLGAVSRQEPENLRLRLDYGYALERVGELDDAEKEFRAVAERQSEFEEQARAALDAVRSKQAAVAGRAESERVSRREGHMNRGYAWLREGNRAAAREEFERALLEDPSNATAFKQIGYLALAEGDLPLAAQKFEAARALAPDDHATALQLGYIYDRLHQREQAEEAFSAALGSTDPRTHETAVKALHTLRANRPRRVYLDVFFGPLYSTRFSNGIIQLQSQLHWRPRPTGPVSLYLGARITHDTRSRGGNLPAIFSDNVALLGAGINVHPMRWRLNLLAEANLAFNLVQSLRRNRDVEPDYRVVLSYYRRDEGRLVGPIGALAGGRLSAERLFSDIDASLGYYSRYDHNVIGYLQLREGLRIADWGPSRSFAYMKVNLSKDTNRDFYNNVAELGAGLEVRPNRDVNLGLRLEYLHGMYYGIESRDPNPYGTHYNDFRVSLLWGRRF